jgi:enoyl-CoA hydratase/carnithine racemase
MAAVEFEHSNHIATVTINRPEARNAMNPEVFVRLYDAFQEVENNNDIRVAIITGTGDKAF